jgi:O-antigen ligase
MASAALRSRLDLAGAAVVGAAVAWTFVSAARGGGAPAPVALLLAAWALAVGLSRIASASWRWLAPATVAVFAVVVVAMDGAVLDRSPLQGPFGYANAAGAFFAQASIAGLMLAATTRSTPARLIGTAAFLGFAALPLLRGSLAAATLAALGPIALVTARGTRAARVTIACCGAVLVVAIVTTTALGASFGPGAERGSVQGVAERILSERRLELWHDALQAMGSEPVTGVGPGRFALVSPTARSDRDAAWAHNAFLQQGAEQGVVGLALLLLLTAWAFVRLLAVGAPDSVTVLGAVSVTSLGVLASIDYVMHFPAVPLAAALLLGTATAEPTVDALDSTLVDHDQGSEADGDRVTRS